jgi:hypothetical protein
MSKINPDHTLYIQRCCVRGIFVKCTELQRTFYKTPWRSTVGCGGCGLDWFCSWEHQRSLRTRYGLLSLSTVRVELWPPWELTLKTSKKYCLCSMDYYQGHYSLSVVPYALPVQPLLTWIWMVLPSGWRRPRVDVRAVSVRRQAAWASSRAAMDAEWSASRVTCAYTRLNSMVPSIESRRSLCPQHPEIQKSTRYTRARARARALRILRERERGDGRTATTHDQKAYVASGTGNGLVVGIPMI